MSIEESSDFSGVKLLCIIIFCIVIFVVWDLYRKRHILKFSKKLNGYTFYPIIGNGHHIIGLDALGIVRKLEKKFNFPLSLWIGHRYCYATIDAAEIKVVLNHQDTFDKHSAYDSFEKLLRNTLLVSKFNRWKRNRKLFEKCFTQSVLQSFIEIFYERSNMFVERLKENPFNDVYEIFERLSLDTFCATFMSFDWDEVDSEFPNRLRSALHFMESRIVTSYFYPDFIARLTERGKKVVKDLKRIEEIVNEVVQKRRDIIRDRVNRDDHKQQFLDILLDGTVFDEDEIFRQIASFMAAATAVSGGTLAFTFTLLGMNPHIQEKVYLEVEEIIGNNKHISYDDLSNLKYTDRAIRESMRLLPIVPLLGRHATADVDLGTRTIPAGSDILISVFHLHRSETHWPNPLEYNPDRFLPEEVAKRHPYSYLPFSGGPRNCIGMKYAMLMMKITVANIIRNYQVTSKYKSVEELEFRSAISMKTTHELDCVFTPRTK